MNSLFKIDGPFYRFGNILYYLLISNLLWVIFSLPLFTIGASTTALFYVMGRVVRDEDVSTVKNFWTSFKLNFKQATLVWVILLSLFAVVYTNIRYIQSNDSVLKYILPVQLGVLTELIIVTIYIFPLLSRFDMTTKNLFKASFFLGNRHLLTTILCIAALSVDILLLYIIPGLFIPIFISLYALCSYYLIKGKFKKYFADEELEVPNED